MNTCSFFYPIGNRIIMKDTYQMKNIVIMKQLGSYFCYHYQDDVWFCEYCLNRLNKTSKRAHLKSLNHRLGVWTGSKVIRDLPDNTIMYYLPMPLFR